MLLAQFYTNTLYWLGIGALVVILIVLLVIRRKQMS
jgi:LPXTG-motif cell wall-anchored protein